VEWARAGKGSTSNQVKALKRQYVTKVQPNLNAALSSGSVNAANAALTTYESWVHKVNGAKKPVRSKLNGLLAQAVSLAQRVYYRALVAVGDGCPASHDLQYYQSSQGAQYGITGWVINAPQVDSFVSFMHKHRYTVGIVQGSLTDVEQEAFDPCRPRGFRFEAVTFTQDSGNGIQQIHAFGGHICGPSPNGVWTLDTTSQVMNEGQSLGTRTGSISLTVGADGSGSDDFGAGDSLRLEIVPGPPPGMRIIESPVDGYTVTPQQTVPLLEDQNC
jgi:hypothetical protein